MIHYDWVFLYLLRFLNKMVSEKNATQLWQPLHFVFFFFFKSILTRLCSLHLIFYVALPSRENDLLIRKWQVFFMMIMLLIRIKIQITLNIRIILTISYESSEMMTVNDNFKYIFGIVLLGINKKSCTFYAKKAQKIGAFNK